MPAQSGRPDYSWQTADRLAQLSSFTAGTHGTSALPNGSATANGNSSNGGLDHGDGWSSVEMQSQRPVSGHKARSLSARHGNTPAAGPLLPEGSLPSHTLV